jgi:NAD(P)-dependent dehydrogenase (short-subunit alcohol dehydrogenase family)
MAVLSNKIALVTGASRGIGYAVAKRFAAEGAQVIVVGRKQELLEQLDDEIAAAGGSLSIVKMDLLETDSIELLAQMVAQRFSKLDILVGNAGVLGELTPLPHTTAEDWDKVIATNLSVNFHLIRSFDAILKQSPAPRAMFVSSGVTTHASAYWGAYAISKAALEKMIETYAAENAHEKLRVNLIDPGAVRTRMRAQAFPGEDPATLPQADSITDMFVKLASESCADTGKRFHV